MTRLVEQIATATVDGSSAEATQDLGALLPASSGNAFAAGYFLVENTGTVDAYTKVAADTGATAAKVKPGKTAELGPFKHPGGCPTLVCPAGAVCIVTPFLGSNPYLQA